MKKMPMRYSVLINGHLKQVQIGHSSAKSYDDMAIQHSKWKEVIKIVEGWNENGNIKVVI